ncbi:MAG: hypothetical protein ACLR8S_09025 [Paraprevotella clara]|uniref:hypothetical protein n=1 Tax=Paraprevotella clara TaxID=454154 RepID=UPI00242B6F0E|nr:hypothetical protein [Paraprevotella clara]
MFGELFSWFFSELLFDNYTLDFDSTVIVREGNQEGAAKGTIPSVRVVLHTIFFSLSFRM